MNREIAFNTSPRHLSLLSGSDLKRSVVQPTPRLGQVGVIHDVTHLTGTHRQEIWNEEGGITAHSTATPTYMMQNYYFNPSTNLGG